MKNIIYTDDIEQISNESLKGFFVDWPEHPNPETHYKILKNSYKIWLAITEKQCVGFINAISDGIFYAFIPLLEVIPEYQNCGIGRELVKKMLISLNKMYAIDIVCDKQIEPFYTKIGFSKCIGMVRRNYQNQNPSLFNRN
ncbi:MAG: GNAT family N-acetyltransferase [Candidatus Cloacimonadota bacterium]|nr:GNAT family N-acetyltransferase [Candidatus Cloacimonadota bacterium]